MSRPLVSVIIPFCNHERYLEQSIQGVLGQGYPAVELLLIDDGSTDKSSAISQSHSPPARYLRRPNGGAGAARNTGIEHASGDLLAFCDADDVWSPNKLDLQMEVMAADAGVDVVFAGVSEFQAGDAREAVRPGRTRVPGALPSAALIRRAAFEQVGPFEEHLRVGEWFDWYARMRTAGLREVWLDEVLVHRRLHDRNTGRLRPEARVEYAQILRSHIHQIRRGRADG